LKWDICYNNYLIKPKNRNSEGEEEGEGRTEMYMFPRGTEGYETKSMQQKLHPPKTKLYPKTINFILTRWQPDPIFSGRLILHQAAKLDQL
jgi:hypothetical protein